MLSSLHTTSEVPATASSRFCATTFMPMAARISSWSMYMVLVRSSRIGCGVFSARICVTTGPFIPHSTMVSPTRSLPSTRITSSVVPRPSITFFSSTVAFTSSVTVRRFCMYCCDRRTSSASRSGMPSPDTAEVGTSEMVFRGSSFS